MIWHRFKKLSGILRYICSGSLLILSLNVLFFSCHAIPLRIVQPDGMIKDDNGEVIPDSTPSETGEQQDFAAQSGEKSFTDSSPDARKRPLITTFSGGELVREKVNINGIEVTRITLRGGASIKHGNVILKAPSIRLDNGNLGHLDHGVTIIDRENHTTLKANRATYDRGQQKVDLEGFPLLTVNKPDQPAITVATSAIDHDLAIKKSVLKSDVRIYQKGLSLLADEGVYEGKNEMFTLTTNPVALGQDLLLSGESIVYHVKTGEIILNKDIALYQYGGETPVETWGWEEENVLIGVEEFARSANILDAEAEKKKDSGPRVSILTARQMSYFPRKAGREEQIVLNGDVLITNPEFRMKAPRLVTDGEKYRRILADRGGSIYDGKGGVEAVSDRIVYDRETGKMRLDQNAHIDFLDTKTGEQTGSMTGSVIEANLKEKTATARGGVEVDGKDYQATGEIAHLDSKADIVTVEGDPSLEKGGSKVRAGKILVYPKRKKVLLLNGIHGRARRGK